MEIFSTFPHRTIARNKEYETYLELLLEYLVGYFKRSQPLYDIMPSLQRFEEDFTASWDDGTFIPVGYNDVDHSNAEKPLWCKYSRKLFANETAYASYLKGKSFQKAKR